MNCQDLYPWQGKDAEPRERTPSVRKYHPYCTFSIASMGQAGTQASHPMHRSEFM